MPRWKGNDISNQDIDMKKILYGVIPVLLLMLAGCGGGSNTRSGYGSGGSSSCRYVDTFHGSKVVSQVRVSSNTVCNSYIIKLENLSGYEKRCVVTVNGSSNTSYIDGYRTKELTYGPSGRKSVEYGCRTWNSREEKHNPSSKVSYGMRYLNGKLHYRFYNNTHSDRRCTITFKNDDTSSSFIVPGKGNTNWMNFGSNRTKSYICKIIL